MIKQLIDEQDLELNDIPSLKAFFIYLVIVYILYSLIIELNSF